jgi:radical SAM protein with 4Fe4S-binding SPASM domain
LASFRRFILQDNFSGVILFTGGDPLLRKDILDILDIAGEYQRAGVIKTFNISGNPHYVTGAVARRLKSSGLYAYAVNIDGLEDSHDFLRQPGSFRQTITALKCLHDSGINTSVKFVLSKLNAHQVCEVIKLAISLNASFFKLVHLMSFGGGKKIRGEILTPSEYRQTLINIVNLLDTLSDKYNDIKNGIIGGEHLFARIYYELGRWTEYQQVMRQQGDSIRESVDKGLVFAVLPDGEVRPRRLVPIKIGRVPQDSFLKIYQSSELLKSLEENNYINRKKAEFEKCRTCPVVDYCGHLIEDSYNISGSLYGPSAMCWVEYKQLD